MSSAITAALLPFLLLAWASVSGCSRERLEPLEKLYLSALDYKTVEARFCASPPLISKQKIKYLFVLDKSDSNQPGFPLVADDVSNTDGNGSRRYAPLAQFLRDLPEDPNALISFGMVNFNDQAFFPSVSGFVTGFDPDRANFENVVRREWRGTGTFANPQPYDRGYTNYASALQSVRNLIRNDAQLESGSIERPIVTSAYRVIFVSDGVPRVQASGVSDGIYTQEFTQDIEPLINQILGLKNDPVLGAYIGEITLNTAYYFQETQIADAVTLLEQMANSGNGQFMKFGAGENIMYGAFAPPIRNLRRIVSDVFVENRNATWWDRGTLLLDADGDGIPDVVEGELGSNPREADTDGNGVSDFVEYRLTGRPCQDPACGAEGRNPYSVCDGFSPMVAADGRVIFPDTDRDGLNDCEEFLVKSDRTDFDSNGDFIPDFLAFKNGIPFIAGTKGAHSGPQGDGLSNYQKLKLGLPVSVSRDKVQGLDLRDVSLFRVGEQADRECYRLKVDPVAILGPNNVLRVFLVENSRVIDDKPTIRVAEKRVDPTKRIIRFEDGDFQ